MTNVDELRRALVAHEDIAADGVGVLEGARRGAARIRRRRTALTGLSAGVTAVAVVVAGVVLTRPAAPAAPLSGERGPLQSTLSLSGGTGYVERYRGVSAAGQFMVVQLSGHPERGWDATVVVRDPGRWDPSVLMAGERGTMGGRTTWSRDHMPASAIYDEVDSDAPTFRAVGWQEPSGAWVIVHADGIGDSADLPLIAASVELGAPTDVREPYQLTWVPPGLTPTYAFEFGAGVYGATTTRFTFGGDVRLSYPVPSSVTAPLEIQVGPIRTADATTGPSTKINGHDTWYASAPDRNTLSANVGTCRYALATAQLSHDQLVEVLRGMRFADCADPATWLRPVP